MVSAFALKTLTLAQSILINAAVQKQNRSIIGHNQSLIAQRPPMLKSRPAVRGCESLALQTAQKFIANSQLRVAARALPLRFIERPHVSLQFLAWKSATAPRCPTLMP